MSHYQHILGCLLGTAIGDAAGLRREGLTASRAQRLYGDSFSPDLLWGHGFCSDDTEHTAMVARSLAISIDDLDHFERHLASQLKCWVLSAPAGIGLATLRACLRLLVGFGPSRSGVFSAGNGPAMRSALLGVCARSNEHCRELVRRSTRLTHTDPKAEEGAWVVASAARLTANGASVTPIEFIREAANSAQGPLLRERLWAAARALEAGQAPTEFAHSQGWSRGISGYVDETVPAALYCWASSPSDFRQSVTNAVLLGGDTDSVAAITGAIAGANLGETAIPRDWIGQLREWPRSVQWIESLARTLTDNLSGERTPPPPMFWIATVPRNIAFAILVLGLGFRRLLPPY
ncbi:MAG: ADP-ribosylglycohydrolase family protein [Planctomycetales bacterium]|nr:ADP-ribosylglycohydrolase family protein [Planctomycetales bacterium]